MFTVPLLTTAAIAILAIGTLVALAVVGARRLDQHHRRTAQNLIDANRPKPHRAEPALGAGAFRIEFADDDRRRS